MICFLPLSLSLCCLVASSPVILYLLLCKNNCLFLMSVKSLGMSLSLCRRRLSCCIICHVHSSSSFVFFFFILIFSMFHFYSLFISTKICRDFHLIYSYVYKYLHVITSPPPTNYLRNKWEIEGTVSNLALWRKEKLQWNQLHSFLQFA